MSPLVENLQRMLGQGKESALLHFSLGNEYLKMSDFTTAEHHLRRALELDADYSAAWKYLGKCLSAAGLHVQAIATMEQGIQVAERKGDIQAAKEMQVFLKRAHKALNDPIV